MVVVWPPCVVRMPVTLRVLDGGEGGACRGPRYWLLHLEDILN